MLKRFTDTELETRCEEMEQLLTSLNAVVAYVTPIGGATQEYKLEGTPENIASLIMDDPGADVKVVDLMDMPIVDTFGCFLNQIYQPDLGEKIKAELIAMQTGEKEPIDVRVTTYPETEVYRYVHCFYESPSFGFALV